MQIEKFYSTEETAKLIRCNAWHIRYMLRNGILRGVKVSPKAWRVPESAIKELIERGSNQQTTAN
jgi:excisionase family DNA binding protein